LILVCVYAKILLVKEKVLWPKEREMISKSCILIVDDDPQMLKLFTDAFLDAGFYRVIGTATGRDIKKIIREKNTDIILLDVHIAGEDSLKILKEVKLTEPLLPVIMLAHEDSTNLAERALQLGACSYVIKSAAITDIVDKIKKELGTYLDSKAKGKADVLVIDDDRDTSGMVRDFLERDGYSCLVANDAKKGLHLVKTHKPDLVFLDIIMPNVDGLELLQQIKKTNKKTKVVMMSVITDKDICMESIKKGASGYIAKPFSLQQLRVTTITTLLEG
jgi:DNA-binding NtrC family response regulator